LKQHKATREFYGFEGVIEKMPAFAHLRKLRAIADLQLLAGLVWAREGGKGKCPLVEHRWTGDTSYYLYRPDHKIQLVAKHRNFAGLLHELAHALGTYDKIEHGPAFRKRCLRLYKTYGDWNGIVE
jgi:hypothetical protein